MFLSVTRSDERKKTADFLITLQFVSGYFNFHRCSPLAAVGRRWPPASFIGRWRHLMLPAVRFTSPPRHRVYARSRASGVEEVSQFPSSSPSSCSFMATVWQRSRSPFLLPPPPPLPPRSPPPRSRFPNGFKFLFRFLQSSQDGRL